MLAAGYRFAYFDGLNRYYLREESVELIVHFDHPVCVFDAMHRFEDFGEPLLNRRHPTHEFAVRSAKALLRALASGAVDPLAVFARDYAPGFLAAPASPALAEWAIRQMLAREPEPAEAEERIGGRHLTLQHLLAEIFASDEFRTACACAAA